MGKGGERPALIPQKHTPTSAVEGEGALYDVDAVALRRRKELFCDVIPRRGINDAALLDDRRGAVASRG